jgi:membrane protein
MSAMTIFGMLKAAFWRWLDDNPFRLGAALAYYTVFSIAPVVLIALGVAGFFFEEQTSRAALLREINDTVGSQVADAIESIVQFNRKTGTGTFATVVGIVVLVGGATTVFAQLQDALNTVWRVKPKKETGWLRMIKDRFWSFTVVLGIGFLLLVSLVLSAVLGALGHFLAPSALPGGVYLWNGVNWVIWFGLVTLLFALIFKLLPAVEIKWRDVWVGAAVTAVLFALGKHLIGLYLGQSAWISGYGAAGSLVIVLLWVYYSSQILLFGAEFTYVYANWAGKPLVVKKHAELLSTEEQIRHGMADRRPQAAMGTEAVGPHPHY